MCDAREFGQAATLMYTLAATSVSIFLWGRYAQAHVLSDELIALADERGVFWKTFGLMNRGCVLAYPVNFGFRPSFLSSFGAVAMASAMQRKAAEIEFLR
jgi:hypothetical protein